MKKYLLIDTIENGDVWMKKYESAAEAIEEARDLWDILSSLDRNRRESITVIEYYEDSKIENEFDGNVIFEISKFGKLRLQMKKRND